MHPVFRAIDADVPADGRLLFINTNHGFFCHRDFIADSFFEASQINALFAPGREGRRDRRDHRGSRSDPSACREPGPLRPVAAGAVRLLERRRSGPTALPVAGTAPTISSRCLAVPQRPGRDATVACSTAGAEPRS